MYVAPCICKCVWRHAIKDLNLEVLPLLLMMVGRVRREKEEEKVGKRRNTMMMRRLKR